ncbi:MAG: DNA primase [Verrucomicrobiota bacterium]|nr:DNA primase [Verrucomicrobiota bacterium]
MAGFFSPDLLEQIRAASDIVEIIGSYIPLKRAGANFVVLCPFHKEKTPSFNVNPHKQIFHCFGCHKGGDVFSFVKEYENIDFPAAVRRLADRAHIPLEFDKQPGQQQARHVKDSLLQIHEQITQRWQSALRNDANGQIARDYLKKRRVSDEAIKLFRLGYAPELWDDTVNWAKSKSFEFKLVEQAGLIIRKEGTENFYDRFRGRLIFPICDELGRVIGFSGRILSGDEKIAKYVNSPETPIFTKGKVFFGLDKSKRAILDFKIAIVCEGQLDLISCFMAGVKNIVAPQGTALTADHARILKRYADEVILCFDSDDAGQNATVRSLDSLLAAGLAVRVATIPGPYDPNSFIAEKGVARFIDLINQAEGFFDYFLNRLCATNDLSSDKGRLAVVKAMAETLRKADNSVLIDKYAQKTALRLGVSPEAMRAEFKKTPRAFVTFDETFEEQTETEILPRPSPTEFWLLKLLLQNDEAAEWLAAHLDEKWIQHPLVRKIILRRCDAEKKWRGLSAFLAENESAPLSSLITEASADDKPLPDPLRQLHDIALRLRNQFIDRQISELIRKNNQPETSEMERLQFSKKQQNLRQLKQQPLSPKNNPENF